MQTTSHLPLSRCPHCNTANPTLQHIHSYNAVPMKTTLIPLPPGYVIQWHIYICASCAGIDKPGGTNEILKRSNPQHFRSVRIGGA
jgi:hypothetical protein